MTSMSVMRGGTLLASTLAIMALVAPSVASAHICLTHPMMRGEHPTLTAGDPLCYQRTPDCGALKKGAPTATYIAGYTSNIQFQQNLNHWTQSNPGYFDVAVSYDGESTWEMLKTASDFPANNMNTQTYFNLPVIFTRAAASAVVRARYVSNNPNEVSPANNTEAIFYSCADVEIKAPGTLMGKVMMKKAAIKAATPKALRVPRASTKVSDTSVGKCVTPDSWSAMGLEYDFQGNVVVAHSIDFSAAASMLVWTRNIKGGNPNIQADYWNITLLPAGYTPQYVVGMTGEGSCSMFGGDTFVPWQYGPQNGMELTSDPNAPILEYTIKAAGMTLQATNLGNGVCLPKLWTIGQNRVELSAMTIPSFPPGTFDLPATCTQKLPDAGCWAHRLQH